MIDWTEPAANDPQHSTEALQQMAELLELVAYWRTEAERLADQYEHMRRRRNRAYLARKPIIP